MHRPLEKASPATRSNTAPKSEVDSLRQALTEAVEQQKATAELLQTRNRELTEAQEQQAATSEILRVIATSPTDVQPVFAAVLMTAARLCDAFDASIFQVDGDALRLVAHEGPIPSHPVGEFPLIRGTTVGRAVLDGGRSMSPICKPRSTSTPRPVSLRDPSVSAQR